MKKITKFKTVKLKVAEIFGRPITVPVTVILAILVSVVYPEWSHRRDEKASVDSKLRSMAKAIFKLDKIPISDRPSMVPFKRLAVTNFISGIEGEKHSKNIRDLSLAVPALKSEPGMDLWNDIITSFEAIEGSAHLNFRKMYAQIASETLVAELDADNKPVRVEKLPANLLHLAKLENGEMSLSGTVVEKGGWVNFRVFKDKPLGFGWLVYDLSSPAARKILNESGIRNVSGFALPIESDGFDSPNLDTRENSSFQRK